MRRTKFTKEYTIKPYIIIIDDEDCETIEYDNDTSFTIMANIQPKTKKLEVSPLGNRIGATMIGFTDLSYNIKEKDGVCVESENTPDYYIATIDNYRTHKSFELIKVGV